MLRKTTAEGARTALGSVRRSGLGPREYLHEVSALVRRAVLHEITRWMTLDPDTMVSTGTLEAQNSPELDRALWRNELLQYGDVHKLAELARRPPPVTALSQLDAASAAEQPAGPAHPSPGRDWGRIAGHAGGQRVDLASGFHVAGSDYGV
jgi:hypothetical protein